MGRWAHWAHSFHTHLSSLGSASFIFTSPLPLPIVLLPFGGPHVWRAESRVAVTFLFTNMAGDTPSHTCNGNNLYQRINQKHFCCSSCSRIYFFCSFSWLLHTYIWETHRQLHILGELAPFHSFCYLEGTASHPQYLVQATFQNNGLWL